MYHEGAVGAEPIMIAAGYIGGICAAASAYAAVVSVVICAVLAHICGYIR